MNWEAVGAIGEVTGAVLVVVSIIYLSIQIRSNTRATKASASFDATHSWATFNEMLVGAMLSETSFQENGESRLVAASAKFYNTESSPDAMSPSENALTALLHRALFQKLEGQFYLYEHGYLEPEVWLKRRDWARGVVELPSGRRWWNAELGQSIYSDKFVSAVSGGEPTGVTLAGQYHSDA